MNPGPVYYIAGPYTDPDHDIRRRRFDALTAHAAHLVRQGQLVYSPITHTHPIDLHFVRDDVHLSSDYWCDFDLTFMRACTDCIVVRLPGWDKSSGVAREIKWFEQHGRPVIYVDPLEPWCEDHHPRQHRDGKAPWCRACGKP